MGLIPEINHAWITVDDKLFLWDYRSPADFTYFEGMSDVIVSVGLAVPQPEVFLPVVKVSSRNSRCKFTIVTIYV